MSHIVDQVFINDELESLYRLFKLLNHKYSFGIDTLSIMHFKRKKEEKK